MIVSRRYKICYLNVGKTGSTSVSNVLRKYFSAFAWKDWSPSARIPICAPQHICHMPKELSDYYVFATARNPYTHEMSRYTHKAPYVRNEPVSMKGFKKRLSRWVKTIHSKLNMGDDYIPPEGCVKFKVDKIIKMEVK